MKKLSLLLVLIIAFASCNRHNKRIEDNYASVDSFAYYHSLCDKANTFMRQCKADSANKYLSLTFNFLKNKHESPEINNIYSIAYAIKGGKYALTVNLDSALYYFQKAYRKGIKYVNKKNAITCVNILTDIADTYTHKGDYARSAFYYRKAMILCDSVLPKSKDIIFTYIGLGETYMYLQNYRLSDYYFDIATQKVDLLNVHDKFFLYSACCNSYYYRKDYATAYKYVLKAFQTANSQSDLTYEQNVAKANIGELSLFMNKYDDADKFLNEAYIFFKKVKNETGMFYEETQLMKLALKRHDKDKADKYFKLSTSHKLKGLDANSILVHNEALRDYYISINNYKKAYEYLNRNIKLNDSTRSVIVKNNVAEIDMRYAQDVKVMKKEMQLKDQKNKTNQIRLFSIIVILLLIIIITGILIVVWQKSKMEALKMQKRTNKLKSVQLMNIRQCLSPHFTFNVLNHEIYNKDVNADSLREDLLELSKLMRKTIEIADKLNISLKEELDFINSYLELANNKFDKNDFSWSINIEKGIDPNLISIPSMIIHISVENALKHGLSGLDRHKDLLINARHNDGGVEITILDNGKGYHPENYTFVRNTGTGQKAMRRTVDFLNSYNKKKIRYTIRNRTDDISTGTIVTIFIPDNYSYKIQ
jgi:tetratricopeptide (TPR) repeat protein